MSALTYVESIGHADHCAVKTLHRPAPARFVWHHIQPQACGGLTVSENLAPVCDNCHYAIHILLWSMANAPKQLRWANPDRLNLAKQGYDACVAAGTVSAIPKEA